MNLNYDNDNANLNNNNKNNARSVRCLRDSGPFSLYEELFLAYRDARRHKRNTVNQLRFEMDLERNLVELCRDLQNRTYEISPAACFVNEDPVKREIVAADFRDRVVHHLLYNWIAPIFERQFIHDSYSCRKGKGTLFGINRARGFAMSESDSFRRECFVLRLDISGFFMNIDRQILHSLVLAGLKKGRWRGVGDVELAKYLVQKIIFHDPLENARYKSPPAAWEGLPRNKSLRYSPPGKGLPIGNLTSQLFGNIYLNPLDHFVKRRLKIRHYGRYVDDMFFVSCDKERLKRVVDEVRSFLRDSLGLTLHPRKVYLQPLEHGFAFLGAYILPYRVYPGKRLVANYRDCLIHPVPDRVKQQGRVVSYMGTMRHYDAHRKVCSLSSVIPD